MARPASHESPRSGSDHNDNDEPDPEAHPEVGDDHEIPSVGDIATAALRRVEYEACRNPLRTVGLAIGVGAVLGGGLPRFATRMGFVLGARVLFDALVRRGLAELAVVGDQEGTPTPGAGLGRRANGQFKGTGVAREPD